jgi:Flp pilus assembly protein TadD
MARFHGACGRLAAGLAAASILGACSAGMSDGRGSSGRLADRSADAGDFQTAAALYGQAFESNPNSVDALIGLGRSYAGMGQYTRAEQALSEANRRRPKDPAVLLELARTQIGAGQTQTALTNLEVAAKKRPNDVQIMTARGIALDRMSRHAEAQGVYRDALKRSPADFAVLSNLGLSLGLSGKTSEGIAILQELVRDPAATARTRGNLALVYGLAGREREASAVLVGDLSSSQIQNNLAYYRDLRAMLRQGRPIGNLDQPARAGKPAPAAPEAVAAVAPAGVGQSLSGVAQVRTIAATPPNAVEPTTLAKTETPTGQLTTGFAPASGGGAPAAPTDAEPIEKAPLPDLAPAAPVAARPSNAQ